MSTRPTTCSKMILNCKLKIIIKITINKTLSTFSLFCFQLTFHMLIFHFSFLSSILSSLFFFHRHILCPPIITAGPKYLIRLIVIPHDPCCNSQYSLLYSQFLNRPIVHQPLVTFTERRAAGVSSCGVWEAICSEDWTGN